MGNKSDRFPVPQSIFIKKITQKYRQYFGHFWWAPLIFISAQNKRHAAKLLDLVLRVYDEWQRTIPAPLLTEFIKKVPVKQSKDTHITLRNLIQTSTRPPAFRLVSPHIKRIHPTFLRFLEGRLRDAFGLNGTAIRVTFDDT